jgi:two-component system chemotaxis response regulator CheY
MNARPLAHRVLVVDDDPAMRELVRRMLTRMDLPDVAEAESGERALSLLRANDPPVDLVICDWNMEGMSGLALFQAAASAGCSAPFLMLTGRTDLESILAAKAAGVPAYILKPVSSQDLRDKVSFLLGGAK